MSADFRTEFIQDTKQQRREREWLAAHLDHEIDGDPAVYKALNPNIHAYNYILHMTMFQKGGQKPEADIKFAYLRDMERWYKGRPEYQLETAFLHDDKLCPAPQPVTPGCRLAIELRGHLRWVQNPADPGRLQYERDRVARLIRGGWDGFFYDEHASGDMEDYVCGPGNHTREYHGVPNACDVYFQAMVPLLAAERAAAGKLLILNISQYTKSWDLNMAVAAGGAQLEMSNYPNLETEPKWKFVDALLQRGIFVNYAPAAPDLFPKGYNAGNSSSASQRWQLVMLANYYMVVPSPPDLLTFTNQHGWDAPFPKWWTAAQEVDLGKPLETRRVSLSGKDGAGQAYRIYLREFEHAYVIIHPKLEWNQEEFGDRSAVEIPLPTSLVPLFADGVRGAPVSRIWLRLGEAAILLKP